MEKEYIPTEETYTQKKDKRVYRIMEDVLGIGKKTKLEKLADSFAGVKYRIHPDEKNPDTGFIEFAYKHYGRYIIKKEESEIKKVVKKFYNEDDYIISVSNHDNGFSIIIWHDFIKDIFAANKKKAN
jgi:hypothetical protein